jgi:hypothetical protein
MQPSSSNSVSYLRELLMIERDLLARIVLKQHCAYRRIDIIDRLKNVVRGVDSLLESGDMNAQLIEKLRKPTQRASERFFQQLSMGLMIPMSVVCLGALGRISTLIERLDIYTAYEPSISHPIGTRLSLSDDEGVRIDR